MPDLPTAVVDHANSLADRGQVRDAFHLLNDAIARGDALAAATLADWRLTGAVIRRDLGEARALFGRAAELGLDEAEAVYLALLASGAGGIERHWDEMLEGLHRRGGQNQLARRQLSLLNAMKLDKAGNPARDFPSEQLRSNPDIVRFPRFLSGDEAAFVIDQANPLLSPSVVIDQTGAIIRDPVRTSSAAVFPFTREDPVLHAINRRIAAVTRTTYEQGEPIQVLSYEPGQQYKLHSDALPTGHNQRAMTFLVYLNDDYAGGETQFPDSNLTHRGERGDGLLFHNIDSHGQPYAAARHAGLPVRQGRKLLLSKWIRVAPLDLSGAPGRPF
ncbi:2OG-Fe(II) oxygenase [Sphingomonas sp. GCM10030256]|uniref:2OG-Fe(II) oxygenase n=1 Tax=Sphingomonas sp. GCM10030256 TaxID=3273427 RepID=UPI003609946F